ncbi:MAG: DUF3868 domain-containing protein [Muribaculaceae bacterium]|nr:DUF3868 domain-containing protein [Muribaculaceae bacterium]
MTNILRHILTLAVCALTASAASAQAAAPKIYDIAVTVDETAPALDIDIDLDLGKTALKADSEIILTPIIISNEGTDSLTLEPVTVCGRNRWYWYVRQGILDKDPDARIYRAGRAGRAHISEKVPFETWMRHCTVELRQQAATCCNRPETIPGTSPHGYTELARIDTDRPALVDEYVFAPPVDDAPVEKNIEGKAFVSFVVNRTELKPDYMVNRREIAKILNSIDYVRNDSDAVITGVHIKGFASPEGSYANNIRLAKGRTQTLSDYVRELYRFDDGIVTNSFEPEDWQGLRSYVADSMNYNIVHRDEIIAIIDSPMEPDPKNTFIQRTYPADYQVILKEIYPWLRHSDYTVKYRIKVYTDIKALNRLYASDPSRLRPVDFYTVAAQYPEGSQQYLDVMKTAVGVYPDDPMLNLNAANIELMAGEYDRAQSHLLKAGNTPQADFARGVLAARRGDYAEAIERFTKARQGGVEKAEAYLENIAAIKDHHAVTITAKLTKKSEEE